MRREILATLAVVALTACGSARVSSLANGGTGNVIPWIDTPPAFPTPTPRPDVPTGTAPCAMTDLHVAFDGAQGITGGQLAGSIGLVNVSSRACMLQGTPNVTLLDARGAVIKTTQSSFLVTDRTDPVLMAPGGNARQSYVMLVWPAIDVASGGGECPSATAAATVVLALPNGGGSRTISALHPASQQLQITIAPCHGLLAVGAFEAVEPSVAPTPTPHPFVYRIDLPKSVRAGTNLQYTVTFTNTAAAPVAFSEPCPYYHEDLYFGLGATLGRPLGKHLYTLNCHPVKTIAPNASVTFAMVLDVPSMATPGDYTLLWAPEEGLDIQDIQRLPIKVTS